MVQRFVRVKWHTFNAQGISDEALKEVKDTGDEYKRAARTCSSSRPTESQRFSTKCLYSFSQSLQRETFQRDLGSRFPGRGSSASALQTSAARCQH